MSSCGRGNGWFSRGAGLSGQLQQRSGCGPLVQGMTILYARLTYVILSMN